MVFTNGANYLLLFNAVFFYLLLILYFQFYIIIYRYWCCYSCCGSKTISFSSILSCAQCARVSTEFECKILWDNNRFAVTSTKATGRLAAVAFAFRWVCWALDRPYDRWLGICVWTDKAVVRRHNHYFIDAQPNFIFIPFFWFSLSVLLARSLNTTKDVWACVCVIFAAQKEW